MGESPLKVGVIVLDVGTTLTKVSIFDKKNDEKLETFSSATKVILKGETSEINMEKLWVDVLSTLKRCFEYANQHFYEIESLCVTGQGEGLWVLDSAANPFMNAILWNDNRAKDVVDSLKNTDSYIEIKKEIGSYIKPGSTLSLLKWLKLHDNEAYKKIAYVFSCKDFIRYKLTGMINWEYSDASCSMMNLATKKYAYNVFEKLDIDEVKEKLPKTIPSIKVVGNLSKQLMTYLEVENEIHVVAGSIDIVANMFGQSMKQPDDISITIGTTGMLLTSTTEYIADDKFNGWEISVDGKSYVYGMGTMAAVPNANLFYDLFKIKEEDFENLNAKILSYKPFESGLLYLPFISIGGERAPFFNPNIKAQLMGISSNTTEYDMIHAIYEGISFSIYDCISSLVTGEIGDVYVSGGLSKSSAFRKVLSNVIGKRIYYMEDFDSAIYGAYRMARSKDALHEMNFNYNHIECNPEDHQQYLEIFKLYKDAIIVNQNFWDKRAAILERKVREI